MKRLSLTAIFLFACMGFCKAQYVTITDGEFRNWLVEHYPSCMSGNNLDTTCQGILNATFANCDTLGSGMNGGAENLYGIQFFKNLKTLYCANAWLTTIPALPPKLENFNCRYNSLYSLPPLPPTLKTIVFECYNSFSFPPLPSSLKRLYCWGELAKLPVLPDSLQTFIWPLNSNNIKKLSGLPNSLDTLICIGDTYYGVSALDTISALPPNLKYLNCSYTNLRGGLPALPSTLKYLDCSHIKYNNGTNTLPVLPASLEYLDCSYNTWLNTLPTLTTTSLIEFHCTNTSVSGTFPQLPASLTILWCSQNLGLTQFTSFNPSLKRSACWGNALTSLPALPSTLEELYCSDNVLTTLPAVPAVLRRLDCSNNKLIQLPALPAIMENMDCSDNPDLKCLPPMTYVTDFYIENTGIKCLPNYIGHNYYWPSIDTLPLCEPTNPEGCGVAWNVRGTVFKDDNGDCIKQDSEKVIFPVKVDLYENGSVVQSGYFPTGNYSFNTGYSTYKVAIDTNDLPFAVTCPVTGDSTITVASGDSAIYSINFATTCKPGSNADVGISNIKRDNRFFPGDTTGVTVMAGDILGGKYGTSCHTGVVPGQVRVVIDGPATYDAPLAGAQVPVVNGDTLTYDIADFSNVNPDKDFAFTVRTDNSATIGNKVCINVEVTTPEPDADAGNNIMTLCFPVANSFDPNEIEVSPPGSLLYPYTGWLTYTIHFQNTGTYSAKNIWVRDTLDENMSMESFQLLEYSTAPQVEIKGTNVLFTLLNINLPDSGYNKEGSKGYITYRVKPLSSVPPSATIGNAASIYFDFNPPVKTNTVVTDFYFFTTDKQNTAGNRFKIYPNPTSGELNVELPDGKGLIEVVDMFGRILIHSELKTMTTKVNLISFAAGLYYIRVSSAAGTSTTKVFRQ